MEMLVAMTLTMLVFAITIPFFRAQTLAVGTGAGRLDALQNARYAQDAIDRELRRAGGVFGQPVLVQADAMAITFNVDFNARTPAGDPNAAFYNAALDTLTTESFQVALARRLPRSTKVYPTATYTDSNGTRSPAETVSFFLIADASSGRDDIYTLYRRVNARDSTVVTSNLWIPPDTGYFFRYYRMPDSGAVTPVAQSSLPLFWNDATRTIDSVGVVEMRIAGWYHNPHDSTDTFRTLYQRTRLTNVRTMVPRTCGAAPAAPTAVTGTFSAGTVVVRWTASVDDGAGASDVSAYSVVRRMATGGRGRGRGRGRGTGPWDGIGSVPARSSGSYEFVDYLPETGTWQYGVAAVDCGPAWSAATAQSGTVTVP